MSVVFRISVVSGQVLGTAALLLGVLTLWGVGWTFLIGGLLLVAGCTAFEVQALGRPAPVTRTADNDKEVN